jgi:hypothetical protein
MRPAGQRRTQVPKNQNTLRVSGNANIIARPFAVISGPILCVFDQRQMRAVASWRPKKRRTFARAARILEGNIGDGLVCDAKT